MFWLILNVPRKLGHLVKHFARFGVVVVVAKNVNNSIVLDCAKQFRTFHFSVQRQSTIPSYLGTALSKVTHPNND